MQKCENENCENENCDKICFKCAKHDYCPFAHAEPEIKKVECEQCFTLY